VPRCRSSLSADRRHRPRHRGRRGWTFRIPVISTVDPRPARTYLLRPHVTPKTSPRAAPATTEGGRFGQRPGFQARESGARLGMTSSEPAINAPRRPQEAAGSVVRDRRDGRAIVHGDRRLTRSRTPRKIHADDCHAVAGAARPARVRGPLTPPILKSPCERARTVSSNGWKVNASDPPRRTDHPDFPDSISSSASRADRVDNQPDSDPAVATGRPCPCTTSTPRGVFRVFDVSMTDEAWRLWRDALGSRKSHRTFGRWRYIAGGGSCASTTFTGTTTCRSSTDGQVNPPVIRKGRGWITPERRFCVIAKRPQRLAGEHHANTWVRKP